MSIRLALIAAACLGAAGCTPTASTMGGAFASLRGDEPPPRTCRNVAADAVLLSARASVAANVPVREPRIGEAGMTEVAWPVPAAEMDQALAERMTGLQSEAATSGCAIAFRDALPPSPSEVAVVPAAPAEAVAKPVAGRSAWNAPMAGAAAPGKPVAGAAPRSLAATPPVAVAPKPALVTVPRAAPVAEAPAPRQAARPVDVVQAPRTAVRTIPLTPQPVAPPVD